MLPVDGIFNRGASYPIMNSGIPASPWTAPAISNDRYTCTQCSRHLCAGVFAIRIGQVVTASSDGAVAARSAEKWIIENYDALEVNSAQ
jgi:thioredoxin reductase